MVNGLHICAAAALLAWSGFTGAACIKPTDGQPELCPVRLPRIVAIQVKESTGKEAVVDGRKFDCSEFRLPAAKVRRYFAHAMQTSKADFLHTLDWAPCHASGTVSFADGRKAT